MDNKIKKPFYKTWWFYAIIILIIISKVAPPKKEVSNEQDKTYTQEEVKVNVDEERSRVNVLIAQANDRCDKVYEAAIDSLEGNLYEADTKIEEAKRVIGAEDEGLKAYKPKKTGDSNFDTTVKNIKKEMFEVNKSRMMVLVTLKGFVNDPKPAKLTAAKQLIQEAGYKANNLKSKLEKL